MPFLSFTPGLTTLDAPILYRQHGLVPRRTAVDVTVSCCYSSYRGLHEFIM